MGQIKNIKLHIVTDIKSYNIGSVTTIHPTLTTMPKTKKDYYDSDSEDEAPKAKRKAKKKKKDPNAPKRPTSAYFFYAGEVRPGIREEQPELKITEVMSLIGEQ